MMSIKVLSRSAKERSKSRGRTGLPIKDGWEKCETGVLKAQREAMIRL